MKALAKAAVECRGDHGLRICLQLVTQVLDMSRYEYRFDWFPVIWEKFFDFSLADGVQLVLLSVVRDRCQASGTGPRMSAQRHHPSHEDGESDPPRS